MCVCPESPWVQRANDFLIRNQNNQNGKWHTVDYLIRNNCFGINGRIPMGDILSYLAINEIEIIREEFQQTILGELKREGIVATLVYPGRRGGVFIPCSEDDIKEVTRQIINRVYSEIENLLGMCQQTQLYDLISRLRSIINTVRGTI